MFLTRVNNDDVGIQNKTRKENNKEIKQPYGLVHRVEHKENELLKSETIKEKIKDDKDRGLIVLKYLRPFLIKLLLHMILLFVSVRAYISYKSSTDAYDTFTIALNKNVLVDVKFIDYNTPCPENYTNIISTGFPEVNDGCRCDWNIYPKEICQTLSQNLLDNINQSFKKNYTQFNMIYKEVRDKVGYCDYLDKQIKRPNTTVNSLLRNLYQTKEQDKGRRNITNKKIFSANNKDFSHDKKLSQKYEISLQDILPKDCSCFKFFEGIKQNKTIDRFLPGKRICVLKDNSTTTWNYLKSIMTDDCKDEFRCQHYFCAEKLKSQKCPIVDIYTSKLSQIPANASNTSSSNSSTIIQLNSQENYEFITSTLYNKNIYGKDDYENTVILPVIDVRITRNGKCNLNLDNNLVLDYATVKNLDCPIDQQVYNFFYSELKSVLNTNDNYYDYLARNLPLFDVLTNDEIKWALGLQYAFHRRTISCLLTKYDELNKNGLFESVIFQPDSTKDAAQASQKSGKRRRVDFRSNEQQSFNTKDKYAANKYFKLQEEEYGFDETNYKQKSSYSYSNGNNRKNSSNSRYLGGKVFNTSYGMKKEKLKNLLILFVNFNTNYKFQDQIQTTILIVNSVVVFFNIFTIIYKILKLFIKFGPITTKIFSYEYLASFFFDCCIAILGGTSFFILAKFTDYLDKITQTDCIDNYLQYQFGIFNDSLQNTLDQNLQIFIFMMFKIFLIFIYTVYYMIYRKCRFRWNSIKRIIIENINEGEEGIEMHELEAFIKENIEIQKGKKFNTTRRKNDTSKKDEEVTSMILEDFDKNKVRLQIENFLNKKANDENLRINKTANKVKIVKIENFSNMLLSNRNKVKFNDDINHTEKINVISDN